MCDRIVYGIIAALVCLSALGMHVVCIAGELPIHGLGLTVEQKAADFEYFYALVSENYPHLWIKERITGVSWLDRRGEFEDWVSQAADDKSFYQVMARIAAALQNEHTHIVSPELFDRYHALLGQQQAFGKVFSPNVVEAYGRWRSIIEESRLSRSFIAAYVAGEYWVATVDPALGECLPVGARILAVNGENVHSFVAGLADQTLLRDPRRKRLYARYLPLPSGETVTLDYLNANRPGRVAVPKAILPADDKTSSESAPSNVHTAVLVPDKIAYVHVRSFGSEHMSDDAPILRSFFSSIRNYPYLVIDIRRNGGGTDTYWEKLLVAPLIESRLTQSQTIWFRSGDYAQQFVKSNIGMGYYFIRQSRSRLGVQPNTPPELATSSFSDPVVFGRTIYPSDPVGFRGRIVLLVDDWVYSSSEAFASFAKATGWATLVGTQTGGDGPGFTPLLFSLPHSGLVFRMSYTLGLNPDGTANEEMPTMPHIYVEPDPHEYLPVVACNNHLQWPHNDTVLSAVLEMAATDSLPRPQPVAHNNRLNVRPQISLDDGIQMGALADWPVGYSQVAVGALWDLSRQRPALTVGLQRYFVDGVSAFNTLYVTPWADQDGQTSLLLRHESGLRLHNTESGLYGSLSVRSLPAPLVSGELGYPRVELVLRTSRAWSHPGRILYAGGTVAYEPATADHAAVGVLAAGHRLRPGLAVMAEYDQATSSRSRELSLDRFGGPVAIRGATVSLQGNQAQRLVLTLQQRLPSPPGSLGAVMRDPALCLHYDAGALATEAGRVQAYSIGIYATITVGPPDAGTTLEAGWAQPLSLGDRGRFYAGISTGLF